MNEKTIFKKNKNIVTRKIEDETILMPLYKTSKEIDCIYTLNEAGARVWDLINGKRNLAKIKIMLLKEYDAKEKEIDKKLNALLKDLIKIKAIYSNHSFYATKK